MIWNWIWSYLLIGVCVIAFEWILLVVAEEGVLFDKDMKSVAKAALVVMVFLVEVVIWPRQLVVMVRSWYKVMTCKLPNEELMEIIKEEMNQ